MRGTCDFSVLYYFLLGILGMLMSVFFFLIAPFRFFVLVFYCLFPFFYLVFFIPLLFHPCFVTVFRLLWVSSLVYPNLLGTKRLGCCC
jgi:hypothetical protein